MVTSELKNLYKKLLEWENVIKSAYQKKEVHLIAHYLESLSSYFHTLWSSSKNNPKAKFLDKEPLPDAEGPSIVIILSFIYMYS